MSDENKKKWSIWFRPGKKGWIKVLARKLPLRSKSVFHLSWSETEGRFAEGTDFKRLTKDELSKLVELMAEAREAGWLR
ncbi:hypothetical protein JCM15519_07220 [Fundidesulfovibrio butyratiphilus]